MSEQYDHLIKEAFGEFADAASPFMNAVGTQAVRTTVIRRQRIRLTFALLSVLLIAVPVIAFAGDPRGNNGPPGTGTTGTMTTDPPTSAPSAVAPSPSAAPSTPDGRLTLADLRNQPMLGCADKPAIGEPVHADLDSDPALETAVALRCPGSDPPPVKLMAYDRDSNGTVVLLGQIIDDATQVSIVRDLTARAGGGIRVGVCISCGSNPDPSMWQVREYAWNGSRFAQVGGPTQPPVRKFALLGMTVTDGQFTPNDNGRNHKKYTVVITNTGTATSKRFKLTVVHDQAGDEWRLTGEDWVGDSATAWHEGVAPGGSVTVVVDYSWPAAWALAGDYFVLSGDDGPLTGQVPFRGPTT